MSELLNKLHTAIKDNDVVDNQNNVVEDKAVTVTLTAGDIYKIISLIEDAE